MKAVFICYPKCTTCQKAKKYLDEHGISYEFRDIKTQRPQAEELKQWIKISGLPIRKFFNTSGLLYKEKNLKEVLSTMSDEEKIELLASDGMLVKRPLLILPDRVMAGYREGDYAFLTEQSV